MTDPERLSKRHTDSLTALLLRAGAEEKPAAVVLSRSSAAVAAVAGAASKSASASAAAWGVKHVAAQAGSVSQLASSASAAASGPTGFSGATLGAGAIAKWIAIGALGGAVAVSSVQVLVPESRLKPAQTGPALRSQAVAAAPQQFRKPAIRSSPSPSSSVDAKELEPKSSVEAPRGPSTEASQPELTKADPATVGSTSSAFLAAEVRFVDRGRAVLQRGAFAEALEQLAPYEARFPHQQLLTEVLFLRMEALTRLGNSEQARVLAARILTLGVVGRQAAQAREVLGQ